MDLQVNTRLVSLILYSLRMASILSSKKYIGVLKYIVPFLFNRILSPKFPKVRESKLTRLGSLYGGKILSPEGLKGGTLISAGCGEDITFDIEVAREFDMQVVLIDPVPQSILHVKKVLERLGQPPIEDLKQDSGKQEVSSYDLRDLNQNQFVLIEKALFNFVGKLSLFPPSNIEHISHSFMDLHKTKAVSGYHELNVECTTVRAIIEELKIESVNLLKLDIEGAQLEVLTSIFEDSIFPDQILVEIDELHFPSLANRRRAKRFLALLKENRYELIARENQFDLSFVRKDLLI